MLAVEVDFCFQTAKGNHKLCEIPQIYWFHVLLHYLNDD